AAVQAGAVPVLRQFRTSLDLARAIELICCALGGAERLRGAIANLLDAVDHPRIMHYIRGEEVLDLDPRSASGEE
ncbi:MAG: hypothetical protein C0405_01180, partial [Desulfovibrio sp.]|nr:hypothetical protein [Desulfovibrio sp.]